MTTDHLNPTPTNDRTDEVIREVRKQGRAAIAAQAAAESCLEAIAELRELVGHSAPVPQDPGEIEGLVRSLIPVSDALDRVLSESRRRAHASRASWFDRLLGRTSSQDALALADGVALLQRQLEDALEAHGVEIDRRSGEAFDPETQRAVSVEPCAEGRPPGVVVAVLRPGFSLAGRVLREADVTVAE